MIRFWLFIPVISLNIQCSLSGHIDGTHFVDEDKVLTRELTEAPRFSNYDTYRNLCGIANDCDHETNKGPIGCEPGEKRRKRDTSEGEDYIVLGKSVPKFKYPWMVLLAGKYRLNAWKFWEEEIAWRQGFCTGSLISMRHVLTARHCLTESFSSVTGVDESTWDVQRQKPIVDDTFFVLLGADRKFETVSSYGPFTFEAEKEVLYMSIPPYVNKLGLGHDLALLHIEDVQFNEKIRPICLPIDGIPLGGHYSMVGFGVQKVEYDPNTGRKEQIFPDALQEVDDVFLNPVNVNPAKKPWLLEGDNITDAEVEPVDGTFAHNGTGVTAMFYVRSADNRETCTGDSGGPLMWKNPESKRYFIMGVLYGAWPVLDEDADCDPTTTKNILNLLYAKVTYWMEYIYREMQPVSHANKMCLPDECKDNNKTTWIQNSSLAAPCDRTDNDDRFLCLKNGGNRSIHKDDNDEYLNNGYAECKECPGEEINWVYSYWMDQITLGSFSRPRYFGIQSPFKMLQQYFKGILPAQSSGDVCKDYEYTSEFCPRTDTCVSADALCDGYVDCPHGWDENPNLCLGKCDYWTGHQQSGTRWVADPRDPPPTPIKFRNAKDCHDECYSRDKCKWYQWSDTHKGPDVHHYHCRHFKVDPSTLSNITDVTSLVVRGPAKCPVIPGIKTCNPILTPPYRNGAFRIQSFSGRFLQVQVLNPNNLQLVGLDRKNLMDKRPPTVMPAGHDYNSSVTEWIIKFHGARQMADSYVTIKSGVTQNDAGHFKEPMYITVQYPVDIERFNLQGGGDQARVFMHKKLNDNFYDPKNNLDQRIYIRPIYLTPEELNPKDKMDLAIYTKYTDPTSKTVKIIRLFSQEGDEEYDHPRPGGTGFPNSLKLYAAGPKGYKNVVKHYQREGRFRMIECDFINPSAQGITELPKKYEKPAHFFRDCEKNNYRKTVLHDDFGLSYNQLRRLPTRKYIPMKINICKALKESHTIWDYAGRMRLTTDGFRRVYHTLKYFKFNSSEPSKVVLNVVKDYFLENIPEYYKLLE